MSWKAKLALAATVAVPSVVLRVGGVELPDTAALLVFGGAVVAAAFILAWAAETAEVDIAGSLAVALLALIAVLPEFAVDLYFAYRAGGDPTYTGYAAANMTGSNRLLIGFGWSLAAIIAILGARHRGEHRPDREHPWRRPRLGAVVLRPGRRIELGFLGAASIYAVVVPLTRQLAWYDAVVLIGLFAVYMWRVGRAPHGDPDLMGVPAAMAALPAGRRRTLVVALFAFAAGVVLAAARPFAEGLIGTGRSLGIDEFLLVQWLAPLASEAPELLVASLFAWRGKGGKGVGTLLSAEVNQWTLLVGALPVAYLVGGGGGPLHLDPRQHAEFVLTSAQAVLGFAVLANLRLHAWEALAMLGLFAVQFALPGPTERIWLAGAYLVLALGILVVERHHVPPILRTTLRPGAERERNERTAAPVP